MHQESKEERDPPKMEGSEETPMSAYTEALDSPSSETLGVQAEQGRAIRATLTPDPRSGCGFFCQPWCLLLTLTLLLLSLLGSWAVVHLTLGTHGGSPFRVSVSYDQRIPQDDAATIEPHFTTNCTMVSSPGPNITLEGQYNCHQGPGIPLDKVCDFSTDCPLGDDEGDLCRHFLNGSYCSFEDGECSWQSITGRGLSWRRIQSPAKATRHSCPSSGATFSVEGGQSKGQRSSALLRKPSLPSTSKKLPMHGSQKGSLSLWIVENSTGPEEQRRLWTSATEPKSESGWKLVKLPLYGLADWFWLQFSKEDGPGPGSAISLDNISLSMDCFLASLMPKLQDFSIQRKFQWKPPADFDDIKNPETRANGEFPPVVTSTTRPPPIGTLPPDYCKYAYVSCYLSFPALPFAHTSHVHLHALMIHNYPRCVEYELQQTKKWFFHTCGAVGPEGPTPTQCLNSYRNSNVNVTVGTRGPFKGIQMWRVQETGTYRITAYGAAGGRSVLAMSRSYGVYITGDFLLRKGELLYILVGQQGEDACPNSNGMLNKICLEQSGPMVNKTQVKGGGGGGGGATYVFKVDKGVYTPLLIAAGGGGRGYSSQSDTQLEQMDYDLSQPGRNGKSRAAGGGGGWNDSAPVSQGGRPLVLGGQGGQACQKFWQTHGGFGGGGGGCLSGGGGGGYRGGNTSIDNNPKHDGDDGTSFLGPEGELFLYPLKETIQQPPQPSLSHLALGLSVGTSALIAALLLAVSGVMIMYRRKHTELQSIQLELQSPDCKLSKLRASTIMTDYNPNYCFAGKTASVNDLKEVPRRNISLTRGLGHGAFGEVYEGLAVGIPGEPSPLQVAVKTLPEVCSEQDELDFLMEALIISKFSHQNIVRCIGVSLQAMPRFILLELMAGGDLKSFLRETRPRLEHPSSLTMVDLLNVARDIAKGCQYLEENQFIHRDIAARNCLLTCKGTGRTAKIGDFGMARDIYRSFGVLLWEIFSLGYMPYPSRSNQEVLEFVTNGGRMDPPKNCPGPVLTTGHTLINESSGFINQISGNNSFSCSLHYPFNIITQTEYGPVPEEEERVPARSDDPSAPTVLVNAQVPDGEAPQPPPSYPTEENRRGGEHTVITSTASEAKAQMSAQPQPYLHQHQQPHTQTSITMTTTNTATSAATSTLTAKGPHVTTQPGPDGGHINLAFTQGHPQEKDGHNGKSTSLWNPTYGSLRRFPCGNIGYGYQDQGMSMETAHGNPNPPPPPPLPQQGISMPSSAAHQRGASIPTSVSLGRSAMSEDSRPLLVTMGTVQDPRLPRMEGHNATVL
ncbi:ALK tyrosine kinase receptor [Collichthys lucidus]|uniref:receptor protein-tyrosine kinase n=1 Tax=Collichthys lucidus TaxID=240159 RepID=A0A4U5VDQ7_COLLU|nr:ALK tyrosine kinase receptor [Collichthys lucidus]